MRAIFIFTLLLAQVFCATYYLSPDGSDEEGDGSEESPFKTVAKIFNSTQDPTEPLELYFYPGMYGGKYNVGFSFTNPLTLNYFPNNSLGEGQANIVQFDCTSAASVPCFSSTTSITMKGLDGDSVNVMLLMSDCSICLSVDNSANNNSISEYYFISVTGVSFEAISEEAIFGYSLCSVEITNSYFSNVLRSTLSLIGIFNVKDMITIQRTNFISINQNVLTITNTTQTIVENCSFTNSFISITGQDQTFSEIVLDSNAFIGNIGAVPYVITLQTGIFTVRDSTISTMQIGCIQIVDSDFTSIINSTFQMGVALNGGAGYFANVATLTISGNSQFNSNAATFYGGGIYLANSTVHLADTQFSDNAAVDGSAIGCSGNGETVFYDNTVLFTGSQGSGPSPTYIQNTCKQVQTISNY